MTRFRFPTLRPEAAYLKDPRAAARAKAGAFLGERADMPLGQANVNEHTVVVMIVPAANLDRRLTRPEGGAAAPASAAVSHTDDHLLGFGCRRPVIALFGAVLVRAAATALRAFARAPTALLRLVLEGGAAAGAD